MNTERDLEIIAASGQYAITIRPKNSSQIQRSLSTTQHFEDGARWADKDILNKIQEFISKERKMIDKNKSESYIYGYFDALNKLRDFLAIKLDINICDNE